jgi:hypothetical protein
MYNDATPTEVKMFLVCFIRTDYLGESLTSGVSMMNYRTIPHESSVLIIN